MIALTVVGDVMPGVRKESGFRSRNCNASGDIIFY
jgi:hypothetical protein